MSATLKEIKNRIKVANNIKKITSAMKLIASIKLKKIQRNFFPFKNYLDNIKNVFSILMKNCDFKLIVSDLTYFKQRRSDKKLIVFISSDKGLCGAYNTNLFNFFEKNFGSYRKDDLHLITVGKKAFLYFSNRNYNIVDNFDRVPDIPSFDFSKKIYRTLQDRYDKDLSIGQVLVIYTKYINSIKSEPTLQKIFPIVVDDLFDIKENVDHFLFEPSIEEVGNYVFDLYLNGLIYKLLLESKLSEFSARYSAMNTATDNADNLIKELKLIFFKKRQESITKELLDIANAVEALK